jgi:hypothetical protein
MSKTVTRKRPIWRCAWADLWHEWPLNLCVILGIGALLFPVAVLYGLKHGAISVLQERLQSDPRSRELRPVASGFFPVEWIERMRGEQGVAFAMGLPRTVSATVQVRTPASTSGLVEAALVPTGAGDPMLTPGALPVPDARAGIISAELAREGAVSRGQQIELLVARRGQSGAWEEVTLPLRVEGILAPEVLDYPAVLVRPEVAEAVEDYLDGLAVAAYEWPGEQALARPAFTEAWVLWPKGEPPTDQADNPETVQREVLGRIGGTGLTTVKAIEERAEGFAVALTNANAVVEEINLQRLREKLGPEMKIWPGVELAGAELVVDGRRKPITVRGTNSGEGWEGVIRQGPDKPKEGELFVPGVAGELALQIKFRKGDVAEGELLLPIEQAGLLRRAQLRGVEWQGESLVYSRRGYASFRLAASGLPEVLALRDKLEAEGIPVLAETQRIADIQLLEGQLDRIFTLFAVVAGAGAVTCLWAIAFSAAERKRRVLAFLQILGATRGQAARFPLYQALWLSLAGAGVAWAAQAGFSWTVNGMFAGRLRAGERISELPLEVVGTAVGAVVLIALSCYLILLPRFVGLPLGEAAREP